VSGYRGSATLRFVSSIKSYSVTLKNQKAVRTLPAGEYTLYLTRSARGARRRKTTRLGTISVEAGRTNEKQDFWFPTPR
jgi:hypothetical protein